MKGNSLCYTTSITPLKRKSNLSFEEVFTDIDVEFIVNLEECPEGVYTVEGICSYDRYGYVDEVEWFLEPYEEELDDEL